MTKYILTLLMLFSISITAQVKNDTIKKEKEPEELEEVRIQSTRTSRTIRNTPTRIETIDAEELEEKSNMRPSNVSMLLHESTGLQVQQTSATSGNASIRVQGLDGRYTQLLKDGYPNFGNFASGLSILEIPPLDLKQVEVIKGPASTLFGGGAIAGVVNFVSKTPKEEAEYNFLINQSNIGQTNFGSYASKRNEKFGYAILGLLNLQKSYDVDNDDFSEIPKANNFTINPRIFYYPNETTTFMLGNSFTKGTMKGGDMNVIDGNADSFHTYFEKNETLRNTTTFEFDKKFAKENSFKLKQSLSFFDRKINIPSYEFEGFNTNLFTDASYLWNTKNQTIITGVNILYDNFKQRNTNTLNAKSFTSGAYIQQTWDISEKVKLENGLRIDNVNYSNPNFSKNQAFVLPKVSALFTFNHKWSSRIGGGLGYKIPTIFTEQTETIQYQNVLSLNNVQAEKSIGGTTDVNFKTNLSDDFVFSINQMFFVTQINKPLVLQSDGTNTFFQNATKPVISNGFETNIKFIFKEDLKYFIGYTFTNAKAKYLTANQFLPLLPKNKLNMALIFEKEHNFKLGLEGFFSDNQFLYNGTKTPTFWEFGFMAEKTLWKNYSFFINFENFTDTRQSKYKPVVNGSHNNPTFDDIWTHTEGFTINGGIKLKL
ncbi:TonB-dependent receptor plug domain-containing protein [Flavobacterium sp.]|uniref:TonB-dependent receptor plug domain-containing protein n=1 Tax=Flavobacterium sp. TaxID=239 RepID=UPI00391C6E07